jgi:hypothetical protein
VPKAEKSFRRFHSQFLGQPFGLFIYAAANVKSLRFEDERLVLVENPISEVQSHSFGERNRDIDGQNVVVARRQFVAEARLDNRKDDVALLPLKKCGSALTKKLTPRRFKNVEIARVVNVIPKRAIGVSNTMLVTEGVDGHEGQAQSSKPKAQGKNKKANCGTEGGKNRSCTRPFSGYLASMDWQQLTALIIVAVTAAIFISYKFRRRKFNFKHDTHCGCAAAGQTPPQGSIVFRARKGQRPEVVVKMK